MHIIRSKKKFVSDVRQAVLSDIHKELSKSNIKKLNENNNQEWT